jgi:hypothetical protein
MGIKFKHKSFDGDIPGTAPSKTSLYCSLHSLVLSLLMLAKMIRMAVLFFSSVIFLWIPYFIDSTGTVLLRKKIVFKKI